MKRLAIALVALTAGFLGNLAFSQEAGGIPEDIMKELNYIAGTWESEGKVGGEEQTGGFTCRWARTDDKKKVCLIGHFSYKTGDEVKSGVTLIGWNAAKKCIEDRGFDANGGNGILYWTVKSSTEWQGQMITVEDGKEVKSEAVLIKKGPSEVVMETESEEGEVARFVFRKVKTERKKKAKE